MKYAITYHKDFKYFDQIDEVIFIVAKGNPSSITDYIPSILPNENQRAIFDICNYTGDLDKILSAILTLKQTHKVAVKLYRQQIDRIEKLKENNIPYFFINIPRTLEQVYSLANSGVSDIYITEELAFRMKELQSIRSLFGVKYRVFPDVTQCSPGTKELIPPITNFFIRPEDTEIYEDVVDVFELFRQDMGISTVYDIYKRRVWDGLVSDYLCDSESLNFSNGSLPPHFGQMRLNCKKKCLSLACDFCRSAEAFARETDKANISITREEYKGEDI